MDADEVRALLARAAGDAAADEAGQATVPKYNGMADPAGAEQLGRELATRLREVAPSAVVVWEDAEDVVLGHVVGRELGLPVVRAYDADGLVGTNGALPPEPRIALVADAVRDARVVRAAHALAAQQGGSLVATAVLVETAALELAGGETGLVVGLVEAPEKPAADPAAAR
jgi:adenine/guanine phosphoribosyltransferase-like PRPP-binding protein